MDNFLNLVQQTLIPPTKVYYDKEGNYAGSQIDIYPSLRLFSKTYAWVYAIKLWTWPLWGPFGYWIVRWWVNKYDKELMMRNPTGWPERKRKLLLKYKLLMYLWISFMTYGYLTDWGA